MRGTGRHVWRARTTSVLPALQWPCSTKPLGSSAVGNHGRALLSSRIGGRRVLEVRVRGAERALEVTFAASGSDKEERFRYPAEYLRVYSPAAAPHHAPNSINDPPLVAGRKYVGIMNVRPVGNYAIQIEFDDLHDTGIYSWDLLYHLGSNKYQLMKQYLKKLRAAGKSRDPRKRTTSASSPASSGKSN